MLSKEGDFPMNSLILYVFPHFSSLFPVSLALEHRFLRCALDWHAVFIFVHSVIPEWKSSDYFLDVPRVLCHFTWLWRDWEKGLIWEFSFFLLNMHNNWNHLTEIDKQRNYMLCFISFCLIFIFYFLFFSPQAVRKLSCWH